MAAGNNVAAGNLADIRAIVGMLALDCTIGIRLIRNGDLIPASDEPRSTRGRAFRRLFEDKRQ